MRSNSSTSMSQTLRFRSVRQSPPLCSNFALTHGLLNSAAEQFMVQRDFQAAFNTCERGLDSILNAEQDRWLKAALCIVGIQATAELNQWPGVLAWILQHYECPEKIPAKIMQMCILLYTKVGEQAMMQLAGFGTVAELYLLHILVPLGHMTEAWELVVGEVGGINLSQEQPPSPSPNPSPVVAAGLYTPQGASHLQLTKSVNVMMILGYGFSTAHPSSFPWISQLLQMLKQMWDAMFAPYYRARAQS
uniref:Peroxisomal biogenesis factor 26 n=1 Tax=Salmo trutta TaxID=8032 RepID=A0A674A1E4_SALTR